jgi:hypothetical protein
VRERIQRGKGILSDLAVGHLRIVGVGTNQQEGGMPYEIGNYAFERIERN